MKKRWIARLVVTLGLVGLATLPVHADDQSDIRDLVSKINDSLGRIKDDLSGIADNVTSPLDRIRSVYDYARQVREAARQLADKHPADDPARTMAERYPDYLDRFLRSAEALGEMKRLHVRQYEASLPRRCDEAERKLKDEISRYTDSNDPEGLQKLPEFAEQLGGPIQRELQDSDLLKGNMSSWKSSARDFSESHERWSDVRDRLRDGAEATYDRWERALDEAHRRCDELAKQRQHREVQNALARLGQNSGVREQLYREMDEYLGRIAELVKDLEDRRDDSEIASAVELADKLSDALGRLSNAKGKDRRAEEIVNRWPGYVERYRSSARALKRLKQYQRTVDHAPEVCPRNKDDLLAILGSSERGKGRAAIELAKKTADEVKKHLQDADNAKSDIQQSRDDARRISIDEGKWQAISRHINDSAARIYEYWEKALAKAHTLCDPLALGVDSPYMEKGMAFDIDTKQMSQCTVWESKALHDFQDTKCKRERKCKGNETDCGRLKERLQWNKECQAAREDINNHCYLGGNKGHRDAVDEAKNAVSRCEDYIQKLERRGGCP